MRAYAFFFSFAILYPVYLINVLLVLGGKVRVRVMKPPTLFPHKVSFLACTTTETRPRALALAGCAFVCFLASWRE